MSVLERAGGVRVAGIHWLPVLVYVALIFMLSAQPRLSPPFTFQNSDKVLHLLEYAVLGVLLARAIRRSWPWRSIVAAAALTLFVGLAVAAGDEWFQSTVPGRDSTVFDWYADGFGLVLSQLVVLTLGRDPSEART